MTFGEKMRALMAERGISLRRLARETFDDVGHLSRVSRDLKPPSEELARALDGILHADGELLALAKVSPTRLALNGSLTPDEEERLRLAINRPSRLDAAVIESLETILAVQRRTEDSIGSWPLVEPVRAQVLAIEGMVTEASGPLRKPLLDVAAQWAQFAGWLHTSSGHQTRALEYFSRTLEWATEVGDQELVGVVMSWKGYVADKRGQIGPMIGMSQAAQQLRRSVGRVYDFYQEARGHAVLGDAAEVDRLTELAAQEAAEIRPETSRPWEYYYFAPGFFTLEHGVTYRILGRTDPARNGDAVELLSAGLRELPEDMRGSEWAGDFVYQLGRAYQQAGEHGEAAKVAAELDAMARPIGSKRLVRLAAELR